MIKTGNKLFKNIPFLFRPALRAICSQNFSVDHNKNKFIQLELKYGCQNYHPIPVVIEKGSGVLVFDTDKRQYFDFLSAYSAVNQGHCHPKIMAAMMEQLQKITLISRAFYNDKLGLCEQYLSELFKYEKVLLMNTGVEGGESAIKMARKWAYDVKKVPKNQARVVFANGNFWGRTLAACASSDDPSRYEGFGPFDLSFHLIDYDNVEAVREQFKQHGKTTAAIMLEPIQGERGVVIPSDKYLKEVKKLCSEHNVLLILDEIQTGLGRTGKLLAHYHDDIRPDIVILGKALSGGFYPVSAVLADAKIMNVLSQGTHGSTYGGNHVASVTAIKAVQVLLEEGMVENSRERGVQLLKGLQQITAGNKLFKEVRGRGLFCAIEFQPEGKKTAMDLCLRLKELGLLAKPTHDHAIRFSPPLIITKSQIDQALDIIKNAIKTF